MSEQPLDEVNSGEATPNPASTVTQLTENSQDNGDTQRRLQQASLALEMALNRIVEVRQSLLQLSQSLPRSRPGVPDFDAFEGMDVDSDTGRMAPAHEMLVLTGDEAFPDPPNLEAMPQWNRRLPPPSAPLNRPLAFSGASTRPRPPSVPARQVMGDDASARWAFRTSAMSPIPDSAATTRGLRVAAREANLSEPDTYTDYLRFINTSYDDMFESMGVFPGPPAPPARPDQALRPVPGLDGVPRSEHRANDRRPPAALAPLSSWRSPDPRRWRLRPNLSPFLPFIAPPNPETHRLPTFADLTAGVASLPNPPTLDQSAGTTDLGRSVQASLGFTPEGDSIVDRYRRYHDAIHTDSMGSDVNIDWTDDDFLSWLFPLTHDNAQRAPRRPEREREPLFPEGIPEGLRRSMDDDFRWQQESPVRVTHTTETQVSPADRPASSAGRRRAWARLDADGNEIPPDEEQELERSRTEYRLRMMPHQRARRHNQPAGPLPVSSRRDTEAALMGYTPSSLYHERGGYGGQRTHYGSVLDSMLAVHPHASASSSGRAGSVYESGEFYVNPLPMPLASMVIDNRRQSIEITKDIVVPTYACLAGR